MSYGNACSKHRPRCLGRSLRAIVLACFRSCGFRQTRSWHRVLNTTGPVNQEGLGLFNSLLDWLGVAFYGSPCIVNYQPGDGKALLINAGNEGSLLCAAAGVLLIALFIGFGLYLHSSRKRPG